MHRGTWIPPIVPHQAVASSIALYVQYVINIAAHLRVWLGPRLNGVFPQLARRNEFFHSHPDSEPMDPKSKQSKRRDDVLSSLDVIIEGLNLAANLSSIAPARAIFSTVGIILTMMRVSSLLLRRDPLRADQMHTGLDD